MLIPKYQVLVLKLSPIYTVSLNMVFLIPQNQCYLGNACTWFNLVSNIKVWPYFQKIKYRISSYSCRRNYSFLEVMVRQLFKGGNYSKEETIDSLHFSKALICNLNYCRMLRNQQIIAQFHATQMNQIDFCCLLFKTEQLGNLAIKGLYFGI